MGTKRNHKTYEILLFQDLQKASSQCRALVPSVIHETLPLSFNLSGFVVGAQVIQSDADMRSALGYECNTEDTVKAKGIPNLRSSVKLKRDHV